MTATTGTPRRKAIADAEAREFLADLVLRRAVEQPYGFDHLPSESEMVEVAERRRRYRSLAVSYLLASEFEEGT